MDNFIALWGRDTACGPPIVMSFITYFQIELSSTLSISLDINFSTDSETGEYNDHRVTEHIYKKY